MDQSKEAKWLLLIHQIPPKPSYFRVKIWRRLQKLGAVAIKSSVYILPKSEESLEAFQWIMREINQANGEASICESNFIDGLSEDQIESTFNAARGAEYSVVAEDIRKVAKRFSRSKVNEEKRAELESEISKLKRQLLEIVAIDFFGDTGRELAEGLLGEIERKLNATAPGGATIAGTFVPPEKLQGRVWVTRRGIHVDRIASAWLIRRFIDAKAKFKYVDGKGYKPHANELRFDMSEGEFTHEGNLCSFEVLVARTHLNEPAIHQIAEIIHEIDLRDEKYNRPDTVGVEQVISGICLSNKEDQDRFEKGCDLFNSLYEFFKRKQK